MKACVALWSNSIIYKFTLGDREMRKLAIGTTVLLLLALFSTKAYSHCQIPCGIYDDELRIKQIKEHITTIEKSMKLITELSKESDKNYNQIVRWVNNKETHADKIIETATHYFLAQRIKPAEYGDAAAVKAYQDKLEKLHHIIVYAMKCKQTAEQANVDKLTALITEFETMYFDK